MRQRLCVKLHAGQPSAEVPSHCLWDLVEALSCQRVAVSYHYHETHFTVTFNRLGISDAQKLLDEWATSRYPMVESVMPRETAYGVPAGAF